MMEHAIMSEGISLLTNEERQELLNAARESLAYYLVRREYPALEGRYRIQRPGAAFVTLKRDLQLRGCIGQLDWDRPLLATVARCAVAAAVQDPRFPPVTVDELPELQIEISVLSELKEIRGPEEIEIGRHGVLVSLDTRQGLLLPQVATELDLEPLEFLEMTCKKACLPSKAWKQGARIQVFEAEVFSSRDV